MEIDAVGTFQMSRCAFPQLRNSPGASIINISATLHYGATWYQVWSERGRSDQAAHSRSVLPFTAAPGIMMSLPEMKACTTTAACASHLITVNYKLVIN